ncbi:hypothetical protein NDU88_003287 [Pleurodeles waltl]|uniref:Flotillin n=1 Tax=Pleurodeles waltl TaxID=8319 RepID=A0AAV7WUX4_PLEWA|nr:hypothetical protein NDU88_003287 [Pleurodeles waltl]
MCLEMVKCTLTLSIDEKDWVKHVSCHVGRVSDELLEADVAQVYQEVGGVGVAGVIEVQDKRAETMLKLQMAKLKMETAKEEEAAKRSLEETNGEATMIVQAKEKAEAERSLAMPIGS